MNNPVDEIKQLKKTCSYPGCKEEAVSIMYRSRALKPRYYCSLHFHLIKRRLKHEE